MKKLQLVREGQDTVEVEVLDDVQEAAFKNAGFVEVPEDPKKK
jgi:hypothetical protein